MNIVVNQNGFVQIPDGYHLYTTSTGFTMLVRNEPLFKEGDVIETTAPNLWKLPCCSRSY